MQFLQPSVEGEMVKSQLTTLFCFLWMWNSSKKSSLYVEFGQKMIREICLMLLKLQYTIFFNYICDLYVVHVREITKCTNIQYYKRKKKSSEENNLPVISSYTV